MKTQIPSKTILAAKAKKPFSTRGCRVPKTALATSILTLLAGVPLSQHTVQAASATWSGATDATWAGANWSATPVPGTGDTATFNSSTANTVINLGTGVTIGTVLFDTASVGAYTIGSGSVGNQTLTLNDGGAITMNSTVAANELFNANLVLGTSGNTATFTLTNNSATNSLTIAGGITGATGSGAKTLAVAGSGSTVISGVIGNGSTGTVVLSQSSSGLLLLSGSNTYSGGTTVGSGTLAANNTSALGTGALILTGGFMTSTTGVNVASSGTAISIGGSYAFATPAITANITLTGATGGNIVKSTNNGAIKLSGSLNLGGVNRTFSLKDTGGDSYPEITLTGIIGNGSVTLDNATAQGGDNSAFGTLLFSGSNTYSGGTTLTMGRLEIAHSSALSTGTVSIGANGILSLGGGGGSFYGGAQNIVGGDLTVANNITINHTGSLGNFGVDALVNTYGNNTLSGTMTLAGASTQVDINGGQLTVSGVISGTGALTKAGANLLIFSGSNSYSGATTLTTGTLKLSNQNALVNSTVTMNGGRVAFDSSVAGGAFTFGGLAASSSGTAYNIALQDNAVTPNPVALSVGANNASTTYAAALSGSGSMTKVGTGTLTLTGSNIYSGGTTISNGLLIYSNSNARPSTGTITVTAAGSLGLGVGGTGYFGAADVDSLFAGTLAGVSNDPSSGVGIDTTAGNFTYASNVPSVSRGLIKIGANMLTLTGSNGYTGATTISAGTLRLSGAGTLGSGTVTIANGANLSFDTNSTYNGSNALVLPTASGNTANLEVLGAARIVNTGTIFGIGTPGSSTTPVLNKTGNGAFSFKNTSYTAPDNWAFNVTAGNLILDNASFALNNTTSLYGVFGNVSNSTPTLTMINGAQILKGATQGSNGRFMIGGGNASGNSGMLNLVSGTISGFSEFGLNGYAPGNNAATVNQSGGLISVGTVWFGDSIVSNTTNFNLNGGTLLTPTFTGASTLTNANLNFNGGTLKASANTTYPAPGVLKFNVYGAGATIDTQGYAATFSGALLATSGTGVTSVTGYNPVTGLTTSTPTVVFSGGGATVQAQGYATVDASGNLTGIVVTNPGQGYTGNPTVTVGGTALSGATFSLSGTATGGGLTKIGSGTLTLSGSNSYSGGTNINSGILEFTSTNSMPSSGTVTGSNGGTLAIAIGGAGLFTTGTSGPGSIGGLLSGIGGQGSAVMWVSGMALGIDTAAGSGTYAGVISNPGGNTLGLVKLGANTLALSASNSFSGNTTVSGGTLAVAHNLALQNSTVSLSGGALAFATGVTAPTFGSLAATTGTLNLATAASEAVALNVGINGASTTFAGVLSGSGSLTKSGGGTLTLSGNNSYSGGTTVNQGTLQVANASALGAPVASVSLASGATLDVNAGTGSTGLAWAYYAGTPASQATFAGSLAGIQGVISGTTPTQVANATSLNGLPVAPAGNSQAMGSGMIKIATSGTYVFQRTSQDDDAAIFIDGAAVVAGVPTSNGSPWNQAATSGTVILSAGYHNIAIPYYQGIGGSGLRIQWSGPDTGNSLVDIATSSTGTVITPDQYLPNLSGAGSVSLTTGNLVVGYDNTNANLSGGISGIGALNKWGTGTLILSGSNTYTGNTSILLGTLQIGGNGTLGGGNYAGAISDAGAFVYNSSANQILSGVISGAGSLVTSGSGTLVLTGSNSYTGTTTVNGGTLQVGDGTSGSLSTSSTVTVNSGGTLAINLVNSGTFANAISMYVYQNPGATVNALSSGTNTISGNIGGTVFTAFNQNGTGTTILTGNNTYFGPTNINNGTLVLGQQYAATNTTINVGINNGLQFGANTVTIGDISGSGNVVLQNGMNAVSLGVGGNNANTSYAGSFSGSGSGLTKTGTGTLTLTGSNSYLGTVNLNGGAMTWSGPLASGTIGTLNVNPTSGNAVFNITGGSLTTFLGVGNNAGVGVINQTGGTLTNTAESYLGNTGYGMYNLTSGTLNIQNWFQIGSGGTGVFYQSGGMVNHTGAGTSVPRNNGTGVLYLTSGTFNESTNINYTYSGNTGRGEIDVAGGLLSVPNINFWNGAPGVGILNLDAGILRLNTIFKWSDGLANVNFNGGTLQANSSQGAFISGSINVCINSGGAIIDTNGYTDTIGISLIAPTGNGVSSISIGGAGYVGAPYVQITGDGTGATGVANIDSNGNITGVTITNSGVGYTNAAVALVGGGGAATTGTVSLSANTSGGLSKVGAGTLVLTSANTYSGATKVFSGTLQIGNNLALQNSAIDTSGSGIVSFSGGITTPTIGGLIGSADLATIMGTGYSSVTTLTLNPGGGVTNTYSGVIANGSMALVKTGAGTQVLSGSNTFAGTTTVTGGTLSLGNNLALQSSAIDTSGSGVVVFSAGITSPTIGGLIGGTDLAVVMGAGYSSVTVLTLNPGSGVTNTYSGVIANGSMTLTKTGSGTQVLTGTNSYAGNTIISGGTLAANNTSALGTGALNLTGGFLTSTTGVNVASSGTAISIGGSYAFATPAITADIALTGATGGNIVKSNNSGSVKLTGALDLGGVNRTFSLKDTSGDSYPEMTLTGVISNGSVTLNNATAQGGDNSAFGTLLFSGSNTYSGGTTLTMGRLEIANSSALGTDSVSIGANGMLSLGGGGGSFYGGAQNIVGGDLTVANNITINHTGSLGNFGIDALDNTYGNNTLSGTITLAGANTQVDINGGQLTISGAMSGTGALTKAGSSILRLTGSNSYTGGTTVNNGTLNVSSDAALGGTAGPVTIVGGATLQTAATFDFVPTRDIVLSSGTGTLDTQGNNNTVNGRLSGAGTLVKSGNGTLTLTGSNSYSGGTTVNGGTLNVVSDAALGAVTGSVTMNNGATLQTSDSFGFHASRDFVASSGTATIDTQGNTNTVNGGLSGAGTLAKSGSGTLILSGSVGIAGLDVNSGSVQLTRSVSIGALNVASGATFSMAANSDGNRNVLNVSALTIASFSSSLSVAPRASSSAATGSVLHADSLGADILTAAGQSQSGGDVAAGAAIEPASPEAVPEPGALGLLLAGALSIFGLRRKGNRLG